MSISDWSSAVCSFDRCGDHPLQAHVLCASERFDLCVQVHHLRLQRRHLLAHGGDVDRTVLILHFLAEALDLVEVEIVAACDPGFVEHLRNQVLLPVALGDQVMESAHGSSRVLRKATGRQQVSTAKPHADRGPRRSEEHTSELQSLMRISYAVFCLKKKKLNDNHQRQ